MALMLLLFLQMPISSDKKHEKKNKNKALLLLFDLVSFYSILGVGEYLLEYIVNVIVLWFKDIFKDVYIS